MLEGTQNSLVMLVYQCHIPMSACIAFDARRKPPSRAEPVSKLVNLAQSILGNAYLLIAYECQPVRSDRKHLEKTAAERIAIERLPDCYRLRPRADDLF
jgi:hypothetical protein